MAFIRRRQFRPHSRCTIFPSRLLGLQLPLESALRSRRLQLRSPLQAFKGRPLPLGHGKLILVDLNWPGSARLAIRTQSHRRGRAWPFSGRLATKQFFAATEVILSNGHSGTKHPTTITCQPSSTTLRPAGCAKQVSPRNSPRHRRGSGHSCSWQRPTPP